jgi:hypothetical protein
MGEDGETARDFARNKNGMKVGTNWLNTNFMLLHMPDEYLSGKKNWLKFGRSVLLRSL